MELRLERKWFTPTATIGELSVDGVFNCFTLEDVARDGDIFIVKVSGATAIPQGRYDVRSSFSPRCETELRDIVYEPNFVGIRIHPGNTAADTDGCILVGRSRGVDRVVESRLAFVPLLGTIRSGLNVGAVSLTIVNVRPPTAGV